MTKKILKGPIDIFGKDPFRKILLELSPKDLTAICQTNKEIRSMCDEKLFADYLENREEYYPSSILPSQAFKLYTFFEIADSGHLADLIIDPVIEIIQTNVAEDVKEGSTDVDEYGGGVLSLSRNIFYNINIYQIIFFAPDLITFTYDVIRSDGEEYKLKETIKYGIKLKNKEIVIGPYEKASKTKEGIVLYSGKITRHTPNEVNLVRLIETEEEEEEE